MTDKKPHIALVGCGKMGGAMLRGWIARDMVSHVDVYDPAARKIPGPVTFQTLANQLRGDIFVLAVKPQIMDEVCAAISLTLKPGTPVLSIAAGQPLAAFERRFGKNQPVIRSMPNTPAAIGKGITVAVANKNVTPAHKQLAAGLLDAVGLVEWVEDEALLDAVTAVSGSGPAYVFLLIETLAAAGVKAGLPQALATRLARQTVIGAAALAEADSEIDAATLRKNVTSPGGTTEAALKVLMESGEMQDLFDRAIAAATERGRELGRS
jgi:pyrroline-5-carboxylate reductase